MREPTPRTSRLAIAASLAAVIAVGGAGFLLGRGTAPEAPPVVVAPEPVPLPTADPTPITSVMDRTAIIALGNAAADAAASGAPFPSSVIEAAGNKFEVLLPFGCNGPISRTSNAPFRWNYDEESSTLRLHVEPVLWEAKTFWGDQVPANVEALEGFWVPKPWSSRETCPSGGAAVPALGMEPVTLPGQTLGLAQAFSAGAPRHSKREGKPYQAVLRIDRDKVDLSQGLQLKLTGRMDKFPDGTPARCIQPAGPEQRPICILAVRLDEVSIVNPTAQGPIATWPMAQQAHSDP